MKLVQSYFIASGFPTPDKEKEYVDEKGRIVRISPTFFHEYHQEWGQEVEIFEKEDKQ